MTIRYRLPALAADVALGVLFAAGLAFTAFALAGSWGGTYWLFGCAVGVVVSLLALARRAQRVVTAVAGLAVAGGATAVSWAADLPDEPSPVTALALSVLVGSAIRSLPTTWAGGTAAAGLAVVVAAGFANSFGAVAMSNVVTWLLGVAVGLVLRLLDARRRAAAEGTRRQERLELARELHDVVAHHITGVVLQSQAAQLVARKRPAEVGESLAGIETAAAEALASLRRVVGLLRDDDATSSRSVPEGLGELVERFDGHGPPVRLTMPETEPNWPPEVTTTVYRVVQESLTNTARYAPHARSVAVDITQGPQAVTVEVADDAPPAPSRYRHRGGYGLVGMRERVEKLGGTLRAGPRPGAGWLVHVTLPVPTREGR